MPCECPSLDSCQKRFFWSHKYSDLAPHLVVGLVLHVGEAKKFSKALGFESLDLLLRVSKQGQCFTATKEDGGDNRLVRRELACEAGGVALLDSPSFIWPLLAIAEAILMRISAVPSLRRVAPRYLKLVTSNFMILSALMLFVPLVMILLFSMLNSIPNAPVLSTSPLVRL